MEPTETDANPRVNDLSAIVYEATGVAEITCGECGNPVDIKTTAQGECDCGAEWELRAVRIDDGS